MAQRRIELRTYPRQGYVLTTRLLGQIQQYQEYEEFNYSD